ncbi:hypothetical protein JCM21900_001568 [Sporobolomyces salmonicolor]
MPPQRRSTTSQTHTTSARSKPATSPSLPPFSAFECNTPPTKPPLTPTRKSTSKLLTPRRVRKPSKTELECYGLPSTPLALLSPTMAQKHLKRRDSTRKTAPDGSSCWLLPLTASLAQTLPADRKGCTRRNSTLRPQAHVGNSTMRVEDLRPQYQHLAGHKLNHLVYLINRNVALSRSDSGPPPGDPGTPPALRASGAPAPLSPPSPPNRKPDYHAKRAHLALVAQRSTTVSVVERIGPGARSYQASHLCANRECFNPDHLVAERRGANFAREECFERFRDGVQWAEDCPHRPRCLLPERPAEEVVLEIPGRIGWIDLFKGLVGR